MKLLARVALPRPVVPTGGRFRIRYHPDSYTDFMVNAVRLIGPVRMISNGGHIRAEAPLPEKYERLGRLIERLENGNYVFNVNVTHNKRSVREFVDSGLSEMDVRAAE